MTMNWEWNDANDSATTKALCSYRKRSASIKLILPSLFARSARSCSISFRLFWSYFATSFIESDVKNAYVLLLQDSFYKDFRFRRLVVKMPHIRLARNWMLHISSELTYPCTSHPSLQRSTNLPYLDDVYIAICFLPSVFVRLFLPAVNDNSKWFPKFRSLPYFRCITATISISLSQPITYARIELRGQRLSLKIQ